MRRGRSDEHLKLIGNLLRMLSTAREIAIVRRALRGGTPSPLRAGSDLSPHHGQAPISY
jgi:hypothetical protein